MKTAQDKRPFMLPIQKIIQFCKEHPTIAKLSLFGSALSGALRPESDIDLLVEFEPGQTPSLFTIIDLEGELTVLLGRKADLRTAEDLSRYFRDEVVARARPLYVKS
jgi:predicted nucleotidyltransferase